MHDGTRFRRDMAQRLHERAKAQVGDLAPPQGLHAVQVQGFERDAIVCGAHLVGQLPVKGLTHVGYPLVHTGQMLLSTRPVGRPLLFARQGLIGRRQQAQSPLEWLGCVFFGPITPRKVRGQPKVKACAFTCHGSLEGLRRDETREVDVQIAQGIPLDGHRLDEAFKLARLGELVDGGAKAQSGCCQVASTLPA